MAAAGFKMAGTSNTTISTLDLMSSCSSVASRHRTMTDWFASLSFLLSDSDRGHG